LILLAWSNTAAGQHQRVSNCRLHDDVVEYLATKYDERPIARGVNSSGVLVEVFASAYLTTWSIVVIRPDGWACLVAEGEDWRILPRVEPGEAT